MCSTNNIEKKTLKITKQNYLFLRVLNKNLKQYLSQYYLGR